MFVGAGMFTVKAASGGVVSPEIAAIGVVVVASNEIGAGDWSDFLVAARLISQILAIVFGPTTPTASKPFFCCHFLTASRVRGPKNPVTDLSG